MPTDHHTIITAASGRQFAASACGLIAFIMRDDERFLMLAHPQRPGQWEPPNGAYDGDETLLDGVMREIAEEAGPDVQVRPLGVVHAYNFRYDDILRHMISIIFLFEYDGGPVQPGDDMTGSNVLWMSVEQAESDAFNIIVPSKQRWLFRRARDLYRLWKNQPDQQLQPNFDETSKNKYGE